MAKKNTIPGRDDAQVFLLKCPDCVKVLEVVNFRTGPLDHIRGIHRITHYGWLARCLECGRTWGSEEDLVASMWVLRDIIEER